MPQRNGYAGSSVYGGYFAGRMSARVKRSFMTGSRKLGSRLKVYFITSVARFDRGDENSESVCLDFRMRLKGPGVGIRPDGIQCRR
jgi:hypothetical protein